MKYFFIDTYVSTGRHCVRLSEKTMDIIAGRIKGSYSILFARIFGLSYPDFFRMVRDEYNATLSDKKSVYIIFDFKNVKDAERFAKECDKRMENLLCQR